MRPQSGHSSCSPRRSAPAAISSLRRPCSPNTAGGSPCLSPNRRRTSRRPVSRRRNTEAAAYPNRQRRSRSGRCGSGNCARRDRCCCRSSHPPSCSNIPVLSGGAGAERPPLYSGWSAKAYRSFPGNSPKRPWPAPNRGAAGSRYPPCR